ncbi:MAG TPA: glycosyltransferase family 39 protein [Acidimicrobiales bacterium]
MESDPAPSRPEATARAPDRDGPRSKPPVPATPTDRRFLLLVAAALLVGLALRVGSGLTDDAPSTDESAYIRSGVSLVEGHGFTRGGHPELHFPPFVPFLLGVGDWVLGDAHRAAVVWTCLSSTALILPLALLGRRVAGTVAGATTAWTAALAPGLSTTLVNRGAGSEAEYALLVVGAVWLTAAAADHRGRAQLIRLGGAGLLIGLAYLSRPEGLLFSLPVGIAVLVVGLRDHAGTIASRLRGAARPAAVFLVPILLCVVPYAAYLHRHTGTWQLSAKTQDASIEAWQAVAQNDRRAREEILYALDDSGLHFSAGRTSLTALARDDPSGYGRILHTNVDGLWEEFTNKEQEGQFYSWKMLPVPVWLLGLFGIWHYRRSRVIKLTLGVAALPVLTALAFFVSHRYLVVVTALGCVWVGAAVAALRPRLRPPVMAAVFGLLLLSTVQGFWGADGGWGHPYDYTDHREAGEWIAAHTRPDDRIMTRSMVVEYYADRPTMAVPYADMGKILDYGRYYGAKYLVADSYSVERLRPQLRVLADLDAAPGLRLVHEVTAEGRTTRVFAFDPPPGDGAPLTASLGFAGDGPPDGDG